MKLSIVVFLIFCRSSSNALEVIKNDTNAKNKLSTALDTPANLTMLENLFPENRNRINVTNLENLEKYLTSLSEEQLSLFNYNDWSVVELFGQLGNYSPNQALLIVHSIEKQKGSDYLEKSSTINSIPKLICGYSTNQLAKIPKYEFKKIDSYVFLQLGSCCDHQLNILKKQIVRIHGPPRIWSKRVIQHIGMIILALTSQEFKSLKPSAIETLDIKIVMEKKPFLIENLTLEQFKNLNSNSKMYLHQYLRRIKSNSESSNKVEVSLLLLLFIRAYLLLRF